jgi:cytochrome c5
MRDVRGRRGRWRVCLTALAGAALAVAWQAPVASMPRLQDLYNAHPQSRPELRDQCTICHVNASGAGPLTAFGEKYDRFGLRFTAELVREYPNLFVVGAGGEAGSGAAAASPPTNPGPPGTSAATAADASSALASAPPAALPAAPFDPQRYFREECRKCHGKYGDGDPLQGVPAWASRKWIEERMPLEEELLRIILKGKDKMIGHEGKISEGEARQMLELVKQIAVQNAPAS